MIHALCRVVITIAVAGYASCSETPPPTTQSAEVDLEEAMRLQRSLEKLWGEGKFREAVAPAERCLALREKVLGATHPTVAQSLNDLAVLWDAQGAYGKAEPLHLRALAIREKALGPMHPQVADSLSNLAVVLQHKGEYAEAEPRYARALAIREKALGPMHPDLASSLNNLAALYQAKGAYGQAEALYVRALDIREKSQGPGDPSVGQSLNNLAWIYRELGAYGKAEPLFVRALDIREKALGPDHVDVAQSLNNLAVVYQDRGAYSRAEPLYVRAKDLFEKTLGPMHPEVAVSLGNLAWLYLAQGAYGKAEPLYARALDIREKALGPMHPDVAISLNNLADLYRAQGTSEKAEPLYARALDIREKALGPMHPDVAASLNSLAALHGAQGRYDKAKPLLVRALEIREAALGPIHPKVAGSLSNLALLHQARREYGEAEPLLVRALAIDEAALGPTHPAVATSLNNLAGLYRARGAYREAEPLYVRATEIRESQLHVELARLSEPRKQALMRLLQGETDSLVSLHVDTAPGSERALALAVTTTLRRKGRVIDSLIDNETTLRSHLTPPLRDQLDQLTRARAELTARLYAAMDPQQRIDRAAIAAVRARIEELESALSAASADFRAQSEPVAVAKVQAHLPPSASLVEFVRYHRFDPRQAQPWKEERYAAYLLSSRGPPQWVALGAAAPIDAAIDAVLAAMDDKVSAMTAKAALRRLDGLLLAPVRARWTGVTHVILAPDGKLNLVPFEALIDPQGHHALESYLFSYVTTGRDLLAFAASPRPRSAAVIVASPDYGPPLQGRGGVPTFTPLADALGEAADLQRYFPTAALTGEKATKPALSVLAGPAMLHIATHGFYAERRGPRPTSVPGKLVRDMFADATWPLLPPPRADDPADSLDRAGLAMAGANQGAGGIVTAREIAGFDWWGTQLVVLSACETGLGAMPSGEGVYGMRRALVLAGASSQVVSLWSVDDTSTRALMRDYYAELARGTGRAEALRRAKLRLMRQSRYAHPYYWAAFIPAGDWRPIDKNDFPPRPPHPD